ncbi:EscU/YscU/HrcU family type III secretion system export apparatus switch protein [Pelagerythrobacter marensis]|uniref:Flagellar biosynthetic protein FlhB n=1 Tax=Pelagerythrobacter marensis TaxID=543877 RepID=A0A0G3X9V7_9SPHN|nr:EscU/YscU/HrcU family type III secretion system export apparatus switch protein [Pelagerythrobacter marensis]AKM07982.1 Flagellar biosynthetic protein FlhB [Pelagerythrobacter marensis]
MEQQEQNRTEEATPFKLQRARKKGQVARGMDLGFVGSLLALTCFALLAGPTFVARLGELMRGILITGVGRAAESGDVFATVRSVYWSAFQPLLLLGAIVMVVLIALELVQLRGFIFTTAPLKPNFKRLDPAQGLKRLFSMRLLKETLKNIVKMAVYASLAWLMIVSAIEIFGDSLADAAALARAMEGGAKRLLFAFILAAVFFAAVDQIIVRGEFRKQMRMGRSEVKRETKEREGEPRLKQKRRDLHIQLRQQTEGLAGLGDADILIVNPEHFAVALRYRQGEMEAPEVRAKGRNHLAQLLKRKARLLGMTIVADAPLARELYRSTPRGAPIASRHFRAVAQHYSRFLDRREGEDPRGRGDG